MSSNYPVSWAGLRPWRSTTGPNTIRHLQKAWRRMSTNRANALSRTGSSIHHCFLCFSLYLSLSLSLSVSVCVTIPIYMLNDQQATIAFFVCFSLSLFSASLTFPSLLVCLFVYLCRHLLHFVEWSAKFSTIALFVFSLSLSLSSVLSPSLLTVSSPLQQSVCCSEWQSYSLIKGASKLLL